MDPSGVVLVKIRLPFYVAEFTALEKNSKMWKVIQKLTEHWVLQNRLNLENLWTGKMSLWCSFFFFFLFSTEVTHFRHVLSGCNVWLSSSLALLPHSAHYQWCYLPVHAIQKLFLFLHYQLHFQVSKRKKKCYWYTEKWYICIEGNC